MICNNIPVIYLRLHRLYSECRQKSSPGAYSLGGKNGVDYGRPGMPKHAL